MLVGGPKPAVHSPPFGEHSVIDQSLIKSGFDLELLLGERYIKYFLLTSFETGSIPWWTRDVNEDTGEVTNIIIHPPIELEQNRLYQPHLISCRIRSSTRFRSSTPKVLMRWR
jgi:hypothetical protein